MTPTVGDRFDFPDEQIHGHVVDIVCDDFGDPAIAIIETDDGKFANVQLSLIQPQKVILQ